MDEERRQKIITEMQRVVEENSPYGEDDPGLSVREWAKIWGVSLKTTRNRLRDLWELGMLETGKKATIRIDGMPFKVPIYRVKEEKQIK